MRYYWYIYIYVIQCLWKSHLIVSFWKLIQSKYTCLVIYIYLYMSRCQNYLSSLGSRKSGIAFGGALSLSMVLQKEARKRNGRGKGKEKEREKEKTTGKEEERKRIGKRNGKELEEERKRIGKRKRKGQEEEKKRKGNEEERKRNGKGKEKERKGRGKGAKRKGVKAEEGKKRKGKRTWSICGLVWGYFLNKWDVLLI